MVRVKRALLVHYWCVLRKIRTGRSVVAASRIAVEKLSSVVLHQLIHATKRPAADARASSSRRVSAQTSCRSQQAAECDEEENERHRLNEVIERVVIEIHGMERDPKLLDGCRREAQYKTPGSELGPRRAPADGGSPKPREKKRRCRCACS